LLTAAYLPETLRKQRPDEDEQFNKEIAEGKQVKKEGALTNLSKALSTSFKPMFILSRDPTVIILTAYNTIIFACLYFLASIVLQINLIFTNFKHFFLVIYLFIFF